MKFSDFFGGRLFTLKHVEVGRELIGLDEAVDHFDSFGFHGMLFAEVVMGDCFVINVSRFAHSKQKMNIITLLKNLIKYFNILNIPLFIPILFIFYMETKLPFQISSNLRNPNPKPKHHLLHPACLHPCSKANKENCKRSKWKNKKVNKSFSYPSNSVMVDELGNFLNHSIVSEVRK